MERQYCESEIELCVHEGWGTHMYMHTCEDQRPTLASFLRSCLLYPFPLDWSRAHIGLAGLAGQQVPGIPLPLPLPNPVWEGLQMHATIASIYVGPGGKHKRKCLHGKYSADRAISPFGTIYVCIKHIYYAYVYFLPVCVYTMFVQCLWGSEGGVNYFLWIRIEAVVSHLCGC